MLCLSCGHRLYECLYINVILCFTSRCPPLMLNYFVYYIFPSCHCVTEILNFSTDPTMSVVSGKQGQCVYKGLTMFDQAVWSPKPCVTCLCTGGRVVCDEITCPKARCHFPFTPAGECCPVCMEPGRNTTCSSAMVQHEEATEIQKCS